MPDNEFTGITQEAADELAEQARASGDWGTLTKLQVADDGANGDAPPGFNVKVTLDAKDVR